MTILETLENIHVKEDGRIAVKKEVKMLKGFKNKKQCIFAYYLFIVIVMAMAIIFREILIAYRFTFLHLIRIMMAAIFCSEVVVLDVAINRILLNNTILVQKDIATYQDCLKFYERITIRKQYKYYFRILQLLPLLIEEHYEIAKKELEYISEELELNITNQIALEYFDCIYYLKTEQIEEFNHRVESFYAKWRNKNHSKKTKKFVDRCIDALHDEENGAQLIHKKIMNDKTGVCKRAILILIICSISISTINHFENQKYHSVREAFNARHTLTEKDYDELNAVYEKELDNYYILITEEKKQFIYYIFEKTELEETAYYLKNSYTDKKEVINQYPIPLIVYEQMRMSQINIADDHSLFSAFGVVKADDIERVLVDNRKPDEITEIVSGEKMYCVWFYQEINEQNMQRFLFDE